MILLPLGVVFAGYTITYYGVCLLKGPGMGIRDLLLPGRWVQADSTIKSWSSIKQPGGTNPVVTQQAVQDFMNRGNTQT